MATLLKPMPALTKNEHSAPKRTASIAEAKANFSALINSVEIDQTEVVVRRRGVAVAKIIPFVETEFASGYGWMRGTVEELGDIVGPSGEEWDVHLE